MKNKKGSLTVETALVLPIFISLTIALISILEMMTLYSRVEYALHETAREISILAYPVFYIQTIGEDVFNSDSLAELDSEESSQTELDLRDTWILNPLLAETAVRTVFTEKFGLKNLNESLIKNGELGIHFFRSEVINSNGDIDLIVTYKVEPFFNLFGVGEMTFSNRARVHAWVGYESDKNEADQYVYITDKASVYHTHRYCTYLNLTINTIPREDIDKARNIDKKKYTPCSKCANSKSEEGEYVYITPYGVTYHNSLSCSGLKRTVYKVKKSEVTGLKECERCASYYEGN